MSETQPVMDVVSGDLYLRHRRRYGEAAQLQSEKGSLTQQAVKAADADGVDVDAMKLVRKLQKQEAGPAAAFIRNVMTYAVYEGAAFMRQSDMLQGNRSLEDIFTAGKAPSEKAVQLWNDAQAEQRGYDMGTRGESVDSLPSLFDPGTSQYAAAVRGHGNGEKFARGKAGDNVVAISGGRGRRGRPPASAEAALPTGDRSGMVDLIKAETMKSAEAMREYYNSFVPEDKQVKKFESRAAALRRLQMLYNEQVAATLKQDAADEAEPGAAEKGELAEVSEVAETGEDEPAAGEVDQEETIARQREEDEASFETPADDEEVDL